MRTTTVSFLTMMFLAGSAATADTHIVPVNAATTSGTGAYTTILHAQARSYQLVIGPAHLPNVPPGMAARITGIQWRMASWQAYQAVEKPPNTRRMAQPVRVDVRRWCA